MITDLNGTAPLPAPAPHEPIGLDQRLLAEAVRLHEEFAPLHEPQAEAAAQAAGGDLERRIVVRAKALSIAPGLEAALAELRGVSGWVVAAALVLAMIAGAGAARVALGTDDAGPVNFFWMLGSMLGLHLVALLLWLGLMSFSPATAGAGSLGGIAFALGRRLDRWLHKGPAHLAAAQALASVYAASPLGRWTLSAVSHALWLGFLGGCLLMAVIVLSIKQFSFAWETTILSEQSYVALTRTLAAAPQALGFPAPDPQQIVESRWTGAGEPPNARAAWSGLLLGSIVVYGILPRALLLGFCLVMRRRAARRFRLDTTRPGFSRLQSRLMPAAASLGVVDPDTAPAAPAPTLQRPPALAATGPPAILGLEIDSPESAWPPRLDGLDWLDLGLVDSRDQRRHALEQVRTTPVPPRLIAVVCSLATTPDRGIRAFVDQLEAAAQVPVALILTDGQRLRARGHPDELEQRIEDWRRLAGGARVEQVVEVDLNHLTEASRAKLARLAGLESAASARRLEQAFGLIVDHARRWSDTPAAGEQAELHRAIAGLYRGERPGWQALLRARVEDGGDRVAELRRSAERAVNLLPERLRLRPRWITAGALAGALGCVAAATLVTPAAIAALPAWAGLGAILSAVIPGVRTQDSPAVTEPVLDFGEAVAGAALFAMLLELQGRDEAAITRILDRVAGEDDPPVIGDAVAAQLWLEALRRRFDQALAAEGHS